MPNQLEQLPQLTQDEQKRVNNVVGMLTTPEDASETVAEVAHDVRNMVTALDLYCDLLQQPGVLADPFVHYGGELRLVAAASRRLVEKLTEAPGLNSADVKESGCDAAMVPSRSTRKSRWKNIASEPLKNLAEELLANRNLLASLVGPTIALTVDVQGGAMPVRITSEDLTRILVNLTRNATEAMSGVGRIHISLRESCGEPNNSPWVTINVEDNGPGLSAEVIERMSEANSETEVKSPVTGGWPMSHGGMGLTIIRSIVEAAGGMIHAANRDPIGACFQIELPVRG